ncbi:MAG: molybdenum cofactor guanylyltransferase [Actinomycetota bacterium]|nr:molybdenum cofactor guanylyltransferase [Actinomycetota bacterium]
MGTDKALIEVDGQRLAERAAAALSAVADPVVEVGPGWSGLPSVREDPPGGGPLAAVAAGAAAVRRAGHDGPVLVLAVDMPRVGVDLLRLLAGRDGPATAVPRAGGHPQPLCARYGPDALVAVDRLLAAGGRSLRGLLEAMDTRGEVGWVEEDEWRRVADPEALSDVDTPDDLRRLLGGP